VRVLVLGSGAREHAIAWKLSQDPSVDHLAVAPGNPGARLVGRVAEVDACDPARVVALAASLRSDLVVVGPEAPLVAGVADALREAGVLVFGPSARAAAIEGSKTFAKDVMAAAGIPTGRFEVFEDAAAAARRAEAWGPVVVKADGLAAGKGVVVADDGAKAAAACRAIGASAAGRRILLEERLSGEELSVIALCDGERFALLPPAQDHKRVGDGDRGPNTGGMGAFAPAPLLDARGLEAVGTTVIAPALRELARRGSPFRGALYAGLMLTPDGLRVLEFNARLGDPETQPLLMQLDEPLGALLLDCARGSLAPRPLRVRPGVAVGVVLAAHGYPGNPRTGDAIAGLSARAADADVQVFHAGTAERDGVIVTAGGRVLTVCGRGGDLGEARQRAYDAVAGISFAGMQFRADIGARRAS
jgi:phosphoribosylamine--glycine ligase